MLPYPFRAAALATAILCVPAAAQTPLTTVRVAAGLNDPIEVASPPGDANRLFVVEKHGRILLILNGSLQPTPFLDIDAKVRSTGFEQALGGIAFHPDYATNGHFFVNYTDNNGDTVIERYTRSATDRNVADPASAQIILGPLTQPGQDHNGGALKFGPDGMLYVAIGDGSCCFDQGPGHAPEGNAQSPTTLLGKMIRLDVDIPFPHVPPSNPYVGDPTTLDEIWSFGLRNPWRFTFDRETGDVYIGDVGQDTREEISFEPAGMSGLNHGWRCMEGNWCTGLSGCVCNSGTIVDPIHDFVHTSCHAVIGGFVYRGCAIPDLRGTYFYGDYCFGRIFSFRYDGTTVTDMQERTAELAPGGGMAIDFIPGFGEDANGELYVCDFVGGEVYKIVPAVAPPDCNANGIADGCDIAGGTSLDVNGNDVPDDCECLPAPFVYCQSQTNSAGCVPTISFSGEPTLGQPFTIKAADVLNQRLGMLIYGYQSKSAPFLGGTLCIKQPIRRTPLVGSGGSPTGVDCTGSFSFDFAARIAGGVDPLLVPGQQVNAQFWSRDVGAAAGTNLTDAVELVICN